MLIHPSQQQEARRAVRDVGVLLVVLLVVYALPAAFKSRSLPNYLTLHMALETLSIVVAGLIFAVVWSVRREALPRGAIVLGCAFLGVGLLDFSHLLSSAGMPAFITPNVASKAIYFWLAARALGALALLLAVWLPWKQVSARRLLWPLLALVLAFVAAVYLIYFWWPDWIDLLAPGAGRTSAKRGFQYALVVAYLLVGARSLWYLRKPRQFNASGLLAVACVMAESSFFFITYTSVTGPYMLAGHIYKVIACVFLYRAVFVETVRSPYQLLRDSRNQLSATLDAIPDLLFEMDGEGRYLDIHTRSRDNLAMVAGELVGKTMREVLSPADAQVAMEALDEARSKGISRGRVIAVDVAAGGRRWFELSVARKQDEAHGEPRFVTISREVTARLDAEQKLLRFSAAVSQSPIATVITDVADNIEFVNPAFTRVTGYTETEAIGRNARALLSSDKTPQATIADMWDTVRQGQPWRGEVVNRTKSGREIIEMLLVYPIHDAAGEITHYLVHQEDVTEQRHAAQKIQELSHYDSLTGLPNRAMLYEYFRDASTRGKRVALLWIDVDLFKGVNDALGHKLGDLLLQEIARRLHVGIRAEDLLARHSADAFVVVLPGCGQAEAAELAKGLLAMVARPMQLAGQELFVTVSIGIALWPADSARLDDLLGKAEIAMYRAKDAGRNRHCFFTAEMQRHTTRVAALGSALQQARQRGELHLAYQPQVSLEGGRLIGAEVLLRWDGPEWGSVAPAEFIPIAEANGLIVPIGEWVLRTALLQWQEWMEHGLPAMALAVNLSAAQFDQSDLSARVASLLELSGVPARCLELELTEAVAMKTPEVAVRRMEELRRHGIRLAIDDFGTGYSSLSYLKQFRIDKLKIDQSFVRDLGHDADDQAITIAIIQLARSLGMRTIAEGVETAAQLEFLRVHGCDEIQGYHYSRPLSPAAFEQFVRARLGP